MKITEKELIELGFVKKPYYGKKFYYCLEKSGLFVDFLHIYFDNINDVPQLLFIQKVFSRFLINKTRNFIKILGINFYYFFKTKHYTEHTRAVINIEFMTLEVLKFLINNVK